MSSRRRFGVPRASRRLISAVAVSAMATSGLGVGLLGSAPAQAASSGTLTWGITSIDSSLDPGLLYSLDPNVISAAECNSLIQYGPKGQLEPELASSWKQTSPTSYVYNLVHNAKFWDGHPVTAADVAFSVNRIADPKLASAVLSLMKTGDIQKAVATGKYQVTIKLSQPNPIAQYLPATPVGQVVEEAAVKKYGTSFGTTPAKMMCSGPYRPTVYQKGSETVLQAVPNYWDKSAQPSIKKIVFQQVGDVEALLAGLRSGAINGTFDLPARDAQTLNSVSNLKVVTVPYAGDTNFLDLTVPSGPFSNPLLRRAWNLAAPRSALASAVDGEAGRPLKGFETPALFTTNTKTYMAAYNALPNPVTPNIAAAKKLVAQAHDKGKTVTVAIENNPFSDVLAAAIQQMATSIGMKAKVSKLTPSAYSVIDYDSKCPRPYDAMWSYWGPDFPAATAELVPPLATIYSDNPCYFSKTFDKLRSQWAHAPNGSTAQVNATIGMMKQVTKDNIYVPLWVDPLVMVEPKNLTGYTQTQEFIYQDFPDQVHYTK